MQRATNRTTMRFDDAAMMVRDAYNEGRTALIGHEAGLRIYGLYKVATTASPPSGVPPMWGDASRRHAAWQAAFERMEAACEVVA